MADAEKALRKLKLPFFIMIVLAIIGVVLIVSGAMHGIHGAGVALLVIGVLLTFGSIVFGFPLTLVFSAEKKKTLRIAVIAKKSERTFLSVLAGSVGCSESEAKEKVLWCMSNGYLDGYMIHGNEVCLARLFDPNLQEHAAVCPNCGASFTYIGKIGQCPYCGDYYPPQNKS
ncbi:MAG: hypothetical protein MJZ21_06400 [archaeon]|nr:hypothetical protein [archaeon]